MYNNIEIRKNLYFFNKTMKTFSIKFFNFFETFLGKNLAYLLRGNKGLKKLTKKKEQLV